jgi:hypothetical protein
MIPKIIELLQTNDFYNVSKTVEIAKGKHELTTNLREGVLKLKRVWRLRK